MRDTSVHVATGRAFVAVERMEGVRETDVDARGRREEAGTGGEPLVETSRAMGGSAASSASAPTRARVKRRGSCGDEARRSGFSSVGSATAPCGAAGTAMRGRSRGGRGVGGGGGGGSRSTTCSSSRGVGGGGWGWWGRQREDGWQATRRARQGG